MVKALTIAVLALGLSACATAPISIGLPCTVGPIRPDPGATTRWTRGEKEQVVALNATGEALCGWKAK